MYNSLKHVLFSFFSTYCGPLHSSLSLKSVGTILERPERLHSQISSSDTTECIASRTRRLCRRNDTPVEHRPSISTLHIQPECVGRPILGRLRHHLLPLVSERETEASLVLVLILLCSDHRIEQSPCLFCAAEAFPLRPDDPIYDSASLVAGQIPDTFLESSNECSDGDPLWRTDYFDDAFRGFEGVDNWQPFGTLDESVPSGTSSAEYLDLTSIINPSLSTTQLPESQNSFLSGISQLTGESLAENSQLQLSLDSFLHGVQQPSPTPSSSTLAPSQANDPRFDTYPSPSSLPSSDQSTIQSASPPDTSHASVEAPDGKKEIKSARANFVCTTCTKSFSNALRFGHHVNRRSCRAPSECQQCGQPIKHSKDLRRHLGLSMAAPACRALKAVGPQLKRFVCTCNSKSYTRKDSLLRHLRNSTSDISQRHRCQACDHYPCSCP